MILFTPRLFQLKGYYHTALGVRAQAYEWAAGPDGAEHISLKPLGGFSLFKVLFQSLVGFFKPVVVQRHIHLLICPIWGWPWVKYL